MKFGFAASTGAAAPSPRTQVEPDVLIGLDWNARPKPDADIGLHLRTRGEDAASRVTVQAALTASECAIR